MPSSFPGLKIVATPLGNAGDLSPRARDVLQRADLVLAEDTRRAARLFEQCGMAKPRLTSFFEHNEEEKLSRVLSLLRQGAMVALMSDAGTPLLSDPGYRLVRACRKEGIPVSPLPGPSAPVAALSASGLPPVPFSFLGFLPRSEKGRADIFLAFGSSPGSIVFFERKDRLAESLAIAHAVLGSREVAICRELTKTHEEFILGNLGDLADACPDFLGEITVIIGPGQTGERTEAQAVKKILAAFLAQGHKPRQAAKMAKNKCQGWTSAQIYELAAAVNELEGDGK